MHRCTESTDSPEGSKQQSARCFGRGLTLLVPDPIASPFRGLGFLTRSTKDLDINRQKRARLIRFDLFTSSFSMFVGEAKPPWGLGTLLF